MRLRKGLIYGYRVVKAGKQVAVVYGDFSGLISLRILRPRLNQRPPRRPGRKTGRLRSLALPSRARARLRIPRNLSQTHGRVPPLRAQTRLKPHSPRQTVFRSPSRLRARFPFRPNPVSFLHLAGFFLRTAYFVCLSLLTGSHITGLICQE